MGTVRCHSSGETSFICLDLLFGELTPTHPLLLFCFLFFVAEDVALAVLLVSKKILICFTSHGFYAGVSMFR